MAIIIKSSRTPRPLKPGEFESTLQELQEAYLQITGKSPIISSRSSFQKRISGRGCVETDAPLRVSYHFGCCKRSSEENLVRVAWNCFLSV